MNNKMGNLWFLMKSLLISLMMTEMTQLNRFKKLKMRFNRTNLGKFTRTFSKPGFLI